MCFIWLYSYLDKEKEGYVIMKKFFSIAVSIAVCAAMSMSMSSAVTVSAESIKPAIVTSAASSIMFDGVNKITVDDGNTITTIDLEKELVVIKKGCSTEEWDFISGFVTCEVESNDPNLGGAISMRKISEDEDKKWESYRKTFGQTMKIAH